MKFRYSLTKEAAQAVFIKTGQQPAPVLYIDVSDIGASPKQRAAYLDAKTAFSNVGISTLSSLPLGELKYSPISNGVLIEAIDCEPVDVWCSIDNMMAEIPAIQAARHAETTRRENQRAENARIVAEANAIAKAEREARQAAFEVHRIEVAHIQWNAEGKAVLDLQDALFIVSNDIQDSRWSSWCKEITSVDFSKENGYGFIGDFVPRGTVEIDNTKKVYLVASTDGSRKYQTTVYRIVLLNAEGKLERTNIATDSSKPGWALRLRDRVKELLA